MGKDASTIRHEIEQTRARMSDTIEALGYKADVRARVKDAVNERVETVRGTIMEAAGGIRQTIEGASASLGVTANVSDAMSAVGEKLPRPDDVRSVARRGAGMAGENPLGLALGALALGLLAGLIAPVKRR